MSAKCTLAKAEYFLNFINNMKHLIIQLMHTNYKILRLLK